VIRVTSWRARAWCRAEHPGAQARRYVEERSGLALATARGPHRSNSPARNDCSLRIRAQRPRCPVCRVMRARKVVIPRSIPPFAPGAVAHLRRQACDPSWLAGTARSPRSGNADRRCSIPGGVPAREAAAMAREDLCAASFGQRPAALRRGQERGSMLTRLRAPAKTRGE